ncbi:hypothetical protein F1559_000092 [Cyanidiococcus yangmingshanensis]|uniref:Uncharacterized protein n=1 Tax=Cyanidiococcus yangmingshanensis TaxID=2690220 RepID=A0A7J7IFQ4_9RHOD|nr:hypothetical protein F1559_000092 [Cyanidiococcus yangmingshanensis]
MRKKHRGAPMRGYENAFSVQTTMIFPHRPTEKQTQNTKPIESTRHVQVVSSDGVVPEPSVPCRGYPANVQSKMKNGSNFGKEEVAKSLTKSSCFPAAMDFGYIVVTVRNTPYVS